VWAVAFAVALVLSFPFRAGELRFDLGAVAGWLALAPLVLLTRGLRPLQAFTWATGAATLGYSGVFFWIYVVVAVHGGAAPPVAAFAVVGLSFGVALFAGLAAAVAVWLEPRAGRLGFLVLPAAWVAVEHLRSVVPFEGFPWAFLGYSAHANGPLRELAALGGVYGLSLVMAVCAAMVARGQLVGAALVVVAAHAAGFALGLPQLHAAPSVDAAPQRAAIVQGNIAQGLKWDARFAERAFEVHLELSRLAAASGAVDLIVWPEAAVTFPLRPGPHRDAVSELAVETGATLVIGAIHIEPAFPGARDAADFRFYNSVHVVTPDGKFVDRYDKSKLVPFGEYLPLRPFLGLFVEALARGAAFADLSRGAGARPLTPAPGYGSDHALASFICYEVIYPSVVRQAVQNGARVLVNVTNDAWYGSTSGPHQFLAIAALRSAEHGLPMIRAANTGVSAVLSPGGRVLQSTELFEREALVVPVPQGRPGPTLYTRLGDWVAWLCWAGLVLAAGVWVMGGRGGVGRGRRPGDPGRAQSSA
jgi:apolipoprotein N-acyltransferase